MLDKKVKEIAYNAIATDKLIGETIKAVTIENGAHIYKFKGYTFKAVRREFLDVYGNPIYNITPVGWINNLPKIDGYRRSLKNWYYSTQSYNIDMDIYYFLLKLNVLIKNSDDGLVFNK